MVCKTELQSEQKPMGSEAYVNHAREMAAFLEDREVVVSEDREMARARLEAKYGIAGNVFWSLRYRPPKQIAAEIYNRLCVAVEDSAERQIRKLQDEAAKARARRIDLGESSVLKAQALAAELSALRSEGTK